MIRQSRHVLDWVKAHEISNEGIMCWSGNYHPYPEVTGYLIPTLLKYGEKELCTRLANWLLKIQHHNGAFHGLDHREHTFDTAAAMEGLQDMFVETADMQYLNAATKANLWLRSMRLPSGALRRNPYEENTALYTCRASALIGDAKGMAYWKPSSAWPATWGRRERVHYIAYALEGMYRMGMYADVRMVLEASQQAIRPDGLMPFEACHAWQIDSSDGDTCATIQMAILYVKMSMNATRMIEAVETMITDIGGIKHGPGDGRLISWAAKYYLDLCLALEEVNHG